MWQKPANCSLVYVEIIGAGAGGGSGRGGAGATSAGGGGGGSGSLAVFTFHAQFVPNIVPIIVGVGGAGGVAVISGSNGNAGQNGGVSNFNGILGTFLSTGGAGGTTTTAANPTTQFSNTSFTWLASDAPTLGVTTQVNPTVGARGATVTSAVLTTFGFQGNQLSGFYSTPSSSMTSITDFKPAITDPIFGMGMGGGGGCITNGVGSAGLNGATPGGGGGAVRQLGQELQVPVLRAVMVKLGFGVGK